MQDLSDILEYKLSVYMWKSFPPFFLVLGSLGNTLAILVLMQSKNRRSTQAVYLTGLATADILVLWVGLFRQWIKYTFSTDVREISTIGCKMHVFLTYTTLHCSSWFLVAFTIERFFVVFFPHKVKRFCNCKSAIRIITLITFTFVSLNAHWMYGVTLTLRYSNNSVEHWVCGTLNDDVYHRFYHKWKWVDICLHSVIPSLLLLTVNISIFSRLVLRRLKRRSRVAPTSSNKEKMSQITAMLCTTSSVFILCTIPISVILIVCTHVQNNGRDARALFSLRWAMVNMCVYMNHVLNFVLYFLSGSKFRRQTKDFFFTAFGKNKTRKVFKINVIA